MISKSKNNAEIKNTIFSVCAAASLLTGIFGFASIYKEILISSTKIFELLFCSIGLVKIWSKVSMRTNSVALGLCVVYLLVSIFVLIPQGVLMLTKLGLILVGVIYLLQIILLKKKSSTEILFSALAITSMIFLIRGNYTWFNQEMVAANGKAHLDTLFHSSIAGMIKNYNIAGTGLEGIINIKYHTFSHLLLAGFSNLTDVSILQIYGSIPYIFFIPILVCCLSFATVEIFRMQCANTIKPLLFIITGLLIGLPLLFWGQMLWDSYFVSESYLVSLPILVLSLPMLFKKEINNQEAWLLPFLVLLSTMTKGSVGLILLSIIGIRTIENKLSTKYLIVFIFSLVLFFGITLNMIEKGASITTKEMFNFLIWTTEATNWSTIRNEPDFGLKTEALFKFISALLKTIFFHFSVVWLAIVLKTKCHQNPGSITKCASVLWGCLFIGIFFISFFKMPGGAVYYFSNVSMFVALPILTAFLLTIYIEHKNFAKPLLVAAWSLLVACSLPYAYKKISISKKPSKETVFYRTLADMRFEGITRDQAFAPSKDLSDLNPYSDNRAKLLCYPAISERMWSGLINPANFGEVCEFYGFEDYRNKSPQNKINIITQVTPRK